MNNDIPITILSQMGGAKFIQKAGIRNIIANERSVMFTIENSKTDISRCQVELMPSDTYRMTFFKVENLKLKEVCSYDEVYCDMLTDIFEDKTKLSKTSDVSWIAG